MVIGERQHIIYIIQGKSTSATAISSSDDFSAAVQETALRN
jgi:hypothetical protein